MNTLFVSSYFDVLLNNLSYQDAEKKFKEETHKYKTLEEYVNDILLSLELERCFFVVASEDTSDQEFDDALDLYKKLENYRNKVRVTRFTNYNSFCF